MGLFSYECDKCRGGYYRCGTDYCEVNCKGGQCCWEDDMVLVLNKDGKKLVLENTYDGYGRMYLKKTEEVLPHLWKWKDFGLKTINQLTLQQNGELVEKILVELNEYGYGDEEPGKRDLVNIYCNSCFKN